MSSHGKAPVIDLAHERSARADASEQNLTRNIRVAGDSLELLAESLECLADVLMKVESPDPSFRRYLQSLNARLHLLLAASADASARNTRSQL